jgi:hypothetical protein
MENAEMKIKHVTLVVFALPICAAESGLQRASPPLRTECTVDYMPPKGWQTSGRILWFSPSGIAPIQMSFDQENGATIAIEFKANEDSEGLERDALRDARQYGNGKAIVLFAKDYSRNLRTVSNLSMEYEGNADQPGVFFRTVYTRMCGGTLGIALRYGKSQSSLLKTRWNAVVEALFASLREVRLK